MQGAETALYCAQKSPAGCAIQVDYMRQMCLFKEKIMKKSATMLKIAVIILSAALLLYGGVFR